MKLTRVVIKKDSDGGIKPRAQAYYLWNELKTPVNKRYSDVLGNKGDETNR